jgi:hypothetical protein
MNPNVWYAKIVYAIVYAGYRAIMDVRADYALEHREIITDADRVRLDRVRSFIDRVRSPQGSPEPREAAPDKP